jgi:nuclear transport factor 2 (NTF2) superfamily protein
MSATSLEEPSSDGSPLHESTNDVIRVVVSGGQWPLGRRVIELLKADGGFEVHEVKTFLARKWARELDYRLIKEVWAYTDNRIAVRFAYEWHDDSGQWFRSYGNENWEFNEHGYMQRRFASINDLPIKPEQRLFHWPLGRRPDDHPSLSDLGL